MMKEELPMTGTINLTAICLANLMGLMLCVLMLLGRQWKRLGTAEEQKQLRIILVSAMVSCLVDPLVFYADGKAGMLARLTVIIGNSWLYQCNLIVGLYWYALAIHHLTGSFSRARGRLSFAFLVGGLLLLVVNLFVPILFSVDENNVYTRGPLFWLHLALGAFFVTVGVAAYLKARKRGGVLQFFPVWQFVLPAMIGMGMQSVFYGISYIWPCITISVNGLLGCLQSEAIYRDDLTGLYNRHYLDPLQRQLAGKKNAVIAAMMIDLNDFKSINDRFGHQTGDQALMECGQLLRQTVGTRGSVIRYAGDEFIVLLSTQSAQEVAAMADTIRARLQKRNDETTLPYAISASIGYGLFDFSV